jgi:phosphoribosylformylglycinamidine synthase
MVKALVFWVHAKNCQAETASLLRHVGFDVEEVLLKELLEGRYRITDYDLVFDPGGFGHGDHIRSGVRVAIKLKGLAKDWKKFYEEGRLFLGICNGFQDMTQGGFLTTQERAISDQEFTLLPNEFGPYRNHDVYLKNVNRGKCIFTKGIDIIRLPIRHAEGRFFVKGLPEDRRLLQRLYEQDQVVFKYVAPDGSSLENASAEMRKKWCYNGSVDCIAGICDPKGIWLGMMPHPEVRYNPYTDPLWTAESGIKSEGDGVKILANAFGYCKK